MPGGKIERPADDDQFGTGKAGTLSDVTLAGITIRGKDAKTVIEEQVTSARLTRTIEGASTLVITITDYDRKMTRSAMVNEASDLVIQNMKFVLVKVRKTGESLELTFEDWAVNQLRKKTGPKKAVRGQVTRAQFAEQLVKEVEGLTFYSPEKNIVQEIYPIDDHNVTETEAPTGTPVSGSGGGGGSGTWKNWARDFLSKFNWPQTAQNFDALLAWMAAESGTDGRGAAFNPLNTTHSQGAISDFNTSAHVKNYPNWDVGLEANHLTLASDASAGYATVRGYFALGNNALATCQAIDVSGWGTQHAAATLPAVQANRARYENAVVAGSSATPARNRNENDTSQNENNQQGQGPGFDDGTTFQLGGTAANKQQIRNIERILKKGDKMGMNDWLLAGGVLCAMRDSGALNLYIQDSPTADEDAADYAPRFGLFQFKISDYPGIQGWTIEQQAEKYFQKAKYFFDLDMAAHHDTPQSSQAIPPLWRTVNDVTRRSMESFDDYGARYKEAPYPEEAFKATQLFLHRHLAYGGRPVGPSFGPDADSYDQEDYNFEVNAGPRQTVVSEPYEFTRGTPERPENSWECLQRLADEVNWRCFCVNRTIYFCRDKVLLKNKAMDTISEFDDGVDFIDFDYDVGKPMSMITVQCRADRWNTIPGLCVVIKDMGPATGRYITQTFERSMFSDKATITLIGETPQLKEPAPDTHVESIDPDGPGGENHGPGGGPGQSLPWDDSLMDGVNRVIRWAQSKAPRAPGPNSYHYGGGHYSYAWFRQYPNYDGPWDCSSFCTHAYSFIEVDLASCGGTTGDQWNEMVRRNVPRGGTQVNGIGRPQDGWKPGDLIWPHDTTGQHIIMATGNGTETVEASCTVCGLKVTNKATDSVQFWARPGVLMPDKYKIHANTNDPDQVDPRARLS